MECEWIDDWSLSLLELRHEREFCVLRYLSTVDQLGLDLVGPNCDVVTILFRSVVVSEGGLRACRSHLT
jgi:hypothetical protein